jgi:hypothetical protein
MAQFIAFDSHVEVSGQSMLITIEAMGEAVHPMLMQFGFSQLEPSKWYPQQPYLDFFRDVASGDFQVLDLMNIGMKVPALAFWPSNIRTIADALFSIDAAYHMNHRYGEIGCYRATQTGDREIEIYCANPYPCDFDFGVIYGVAQVYLSESVIPQVDHLPGECRKNGGHACTYVVQW